jgi:mono/diheme cytochrome c family protein
MPYRVLAVGELCLLLFTAASCAMAANARVEFNRDIRPIFSDKCYTCHGPDAAAKHVPFRLDSEAAAKAELSGGKHAIVAGDADSSEIIRRVSAAKPALRMPPVSSGLKLSDAEIDTLRQWIAQGAEWQKHWSFIAPVRPSLPDVNNATWPRNPIDRFIFERLEREGLQPAPQASRETLIRRVSLDLTGLPPTPAEIDAFLNDHSTNAYEKVVDRLLASPRYGERMAFRWLDGARYADSNGYQFDGERSMWRWRDWVIDAFNRNQPFNQFTLEQIAGDMLPNATLDQKIATGFNRNHRANTEDGIIPEEYAVEYVVDRVETTSAVFLGVTLGCARCHNHKYDPFTQKEFYQIFAYFNNVPEMGRAMKYGNSPPMVAAPTHEQQLTLDNVDSHIRTIEDFLRRRDQETAGAQRDWQRKMATGEPAYWAPSRALKGLFSFETDGEAKSQDGVVTFAPGRIGRAASFDGKVFLDGGSAADFDIEQQFTLAAWIYSDATLDGSLMSRMVDNPKGKGFGVHLDQGKVYVNITSNWDDDAIRLQTEQVLEPKKWHQVTVTYSGSRMAEGIHVYVDGQRAKVNVLLDTLYRPFRNAGAIFRQPFRIVAGWGPERRFRGQIDDVRVYSRVLEQDEIAVLAAGEPINEIARKPSQQRSEIETLQLHSYYLDNIAPQDIRDARRQLASLQDEKEKFESTLSSVMVMAESPTPKPTFLLERGAYDHHGAQVSPGLPAVLPTLPAGAPNNRLGFAQWLTDSGNPLLSRVTVNRFWQMYFGTGIVKTVEDFGSQGEWPSDPELLDWLATEFIRTGWNVKALQKLIVTSAAYRQSSKATPDLLQRDPENRLLARGPRLRLAAEMIRDQALFDAGLLVEKVGGPSVKPYSPPGLWKEVSMQDTEYVQSHGDDLHRRSLYTFWKRTIPPPEMINFDAANREACVVRETRTDTPLQALNLMNDVTYLEAARFLGQRMMKEGGPTPDARLRFGFRLVTGHFPSAVEQGVLTGSLQFHRAYFDGKPKEAAEYLNQGELPADPKLDPVELAAYASVGSLLLNLDEAISKE